MIEVRLEATQHTAGVHAVGCKGDSIDPHDHSHGCKANLHYRITAAVVLRTEDHLDGMILSGMWSGLSAVWETVEPIRRLQRHNHFLQAIVTTPV